MCKEHTNVYTVSEVRVPAQSEERYLRKNSFINQGVMEMWGVAASQLGGPQFVLSVLTVYVVFVKFRVPVCSVGSLNFQKS